MPTLTPKIDTRVALLERDLEQTTELNTKMDKSIDKLSEIAGTLTKIVAVHEEKLQKVERVNSDIMVVLEGRRVEMGDVVKDLANKIDRVHTDLKDEIHIVESKLMSAIGAVEHSTEQEKEKTEARIAALEKWRWIVAGIGLAVGFLAGKLPFGTLVDIARNLSGS